jgi:cell wall-associated NlpC family hydrolase
MSPVAFVTAARAYLGAPWRHLGRSRSGVDCIGLVLLAARQAGVEIPDPAPYGRDPDGRLLTGVRRHARRVAPPADGDVLLFRLEDRAAHVGICTTHPSYHVQAVLHAYAKRGAVVEERLTPELEAAFVGAFRIAEA